ncbi:MAG: ABC transporter permease [Ruthenibacterium sp.]
MLVAILIACGIACAIIVAVSDDPGAAIASLFTGPLSNTRRFSNVIEMMIPLVFTGMSLNIAFKCGLFNMGADGSFYMGAIFAALIAIKMPLANGLHQTVLIIVAALVGGVITTLPALIKKFTGANELVTSLMFNYIFFHMGMFILNHFMLDDTTGYASYKFLKTAKLGRMIEGTQLHYGLIIMIVAWLIIYFVSEKSALGYKLKVTGANMSFAKYSGIQITGAVLASQFIAGVLAGMGGAIEMVGMNTRFTWNLPVQYVWDGILINLLANSKVSMIPIAALFISFIRIGADVMSRNTGVDNQIVAIIQGVMIVLIASEKFLYFLKKRKEEKEALANEAVTI